MALRHDLEALKVSIHERDGQAKALEDRARDRQKVVSKATADAKILAQAQEIIQCVIEARRQELRDRVEMLVTRGLRAVFRRQDIEFFFRQVAQDGRFMLIPCVRSAFQGAKTESVVKEGRGGGVADVTSFILRVVVMSLSRPKVAPILILDEPFRHVSQDFLRGCADLLQELNKSGGIQFLIVTHKPELLDAADVIYRCRIKNGLTDYFIEHSTKDGAFHMKPKKSLTIDDTERT